MRGAYNEADPVFGGTDIPSQFPHMKKVRMRYGESVLNRGNLVSDPDRLKIRKLQLKHPGDDPTRFIDEQTHNEYVFRGPMDTNPLTGEKFPKVYRYPDYNLHGDRLASKLDIPINSKTSFMKLTHQGNNRKGVVGGHYMDKVLRGVGPHGNHIPGSTPKNNVHPHFIEGRPIR